MLNGSVQRFVAILSRLWQYMERMMDDHLDSLAFRFFKLFAQYESSLKEHGYFTAGRKGRIDVDWDRFANEIVGPTFRKKLGASASAADYILENPPMRQAVGPENKIIWDQVSNEDKSVQALFGHLCRIRNNLFHGAKFNGTWFDRERSASLLEKGLEILEHFRRSLPH